MLTLFILAALAAGIAFITLSLRLRSLAGQARQWPGVPGVVVESHVDDRDLEFLKPVIRYRYEVAGVQHVGTRVAFSGYGVSVAAMRELVAPYPVGTAVTVRYDPAYPARAVLDASARSDWPYWFVAGLGFIGLGVWLLQR